MALLLYQSSTPLHATGLYIKGLKKQCLIQLIQSLNQRFIRQWTCNKILQSTQWNMRSLRKFLCESNCAISNKITLPSSSRNSLGLRHPRDTGGGKVEHWTDDAIAIGRAGYKSIPAGSPQCPRRFISLTRHVRLERLCFLWRCFPSVYGTYRRGGGEGRNHSECPWKLSWWRSHPGGTYSHIIYASLLRDASKDEREVA